MLHLTSVAGDKLRADRGTRLGAVRMDSGRPACGTACVQHTRTQCQGDTRQRATSCVLVTSAAAYPSHITVHEWGVCEAALDRNVGRNRPRHNPQPTPPFLEHTHKHTSYLLRALLRVWQRPRQTKLAGPTLSTLHGCAAAKQGGALCVNHSQEAETQEHMPGCEAGTVMDPGCVGLLAAMPVLSDQLWLCCDL